MFILYKDTIQKKVIAGKIKERCMIVSWAKGLRC